MIRSIEKGSLLQFFLLPRSSCTEVIYVYEGNGEITHVCTYTSLETWGWIFLVPTVPRRRERSSRFVLQQGRPFAMEVVEIRISVLSVSCQAY
ncbi:hypothetical protein SODALDRAFT_139261 [Sodiomyces alkalinus F11]|uniref:Uncharacterized protein n=1 Tax=Sodiomyces alkalinus (strain CBS 110278 / VKM F-3762 / F11) TaxID=1314773 RepID=A0A3N2PZ92_SODAK|nr:hypothetical protein SODALDRAFT_139261 [Sodiomyces alkalinus F11]ROT39849.1 hypothetical protein SODALDRAFT_139261 [Sodiomyces alkalinus F11]